MNSFTLSLAYLRHKKLLTALHVLTFAGGIAIITALMLFSAQAQNAFSKNLAGIDLVVGAKGSPLQLILSSVFHADIPTGNIQLAEAERLAKHPLVSEAIPLALGDNVQGFRIVGTPPAYALHYGATLTPDGHWQQSPMEAVLGAEAARKTGLALGGSFVGAHGLTQGGEEHAAFPYRVVGIMKPTGTVLDRLVLTPVESVWQIHAHREENEDEEDVKARLSAEAHEITALLITYKSPLAAAGLPRLVNASTSMQAASPAFEMARLNNMLGIGTDTLEGFGAFLVGLAGLGVFASLYGAMEERRYDLALLRSLGASPAKLFSLVAGESLTVALMGALIGMLAGHALVWLAEIWTGQARRFPLTGLIFLPEEAWLVIAALAIGVIAAIIPFMRAYRTDIVSALTEQ